MAANTILLVEDNASDIDLTRRALAKNCITNPIVIAEDGQQALDYLFGTGAYSERDTGEQPLLTLLDLNLPKVSGLTVLKRMRQDTRTRRLPVVILTSSLEHGDLSTSYDLGINSYIRKPVDFGQFAAVIEQLGLYWLVLNQRPPSS
jgi:two-component system, response regulator